MPTSALTFFNAFKADTNNKVHNLASDQVTVALTAAANAPVATNSVLANLTEVAYTNLSTRNITLTSSTQTSGTYKLIQADLTLTASGNVATFRYVVLYNSTASGGPLIGWYDYGSNVAMVSGDTFVIDLSQANGTFSLT